MCSVLPYQPGAEPITLADGSDTEAPTSALAIGMLHQALRAAYTDFVRVHVVSYCLQKDGRLRSELVAHSRWLSAMDIHPEKDLIVTAAEDCTIGVWSLPIAGGKVCWLTSFFTKDTSCLPHYLLTCWCLFSRAYGRLACTAPGRLATKSNWVALFLAAVSGTDMLGPLQS